MNSVRKMARRITGENEFIKEDQENVISWM